MTKRELVARIADNTDLTKKDVACVLSEFAASMHNAIQQPGGNVTLRGLFTLKAYRAKAGKRRNPQTGAQVMVPETGKIKFIPGKHLKESAEIGVGTKTIT